MVVARVLYLSHGTDNHINALNIDMVMTTTQKTETMLLNSGATENFICHPLRLEAITRTLLGAEAHAWSSRL